MAIIKPTILLVHGSYHSPACFDPLKSRLESLSYHVLAVDLPCTGRRSPTATHIDDVAAIHQLIVPVMDNGAEIVVVAHSYGGVPGCAAIEGQSVEERAFRAEKGGIKSILFIAAFAIPERGQHCMASYDKEADWADIDGEYAVCKPAAKDVFYHDLPEEEQDYWYSLLRPTTLASVFTPVEFIPKDLKIPSTYLVCEKDKVMSVPLQEGYIANVPGMKTERCDAGHSPFLSRVDRTLEVIVKVAEG